VDLLKRFQAAGKDGVDFRGAPFWSWNDDLEPRELQRQIRQMKKAGLGGHFMHARIGLITPYMGERWMECIKAAVDESSKIGMKAWLYDEDCWPSGSGGGVIPAKGEEYLQKRLVCDEIEPKKFKPKKLEHPERVVAAFAAFKGKNGFNRFERLDDKPPADCDAVVVFRYETTGYVDLLSEKVVTAFIEADYEPYAREVGEYFGDVVPGIFTDEPNYTNPPWSLELPDFFKERIGYDLIPALPCLFYEIGDFVKVRYDYLRAVTMRYVENYSGRIGRWCGEHNLEFTGHQLCEDSLTLQVRHIGAAMPHYMHMQRPGIDHLCRRLGTTALCKQVSSVAHQFGGRRVLSEMYGCSGWNASMEELKWIGDWQYVLGVNFPCQHLSLYSMRGCRKRDYPPSLHYQQPYWPAAYKRLNDRFARLLAALTYGEHQTELVMLHAIGSAWAAWHPTNDAAMNEDSEKFEQLSTMFLEIQRDYDYGDELIMAEHGSVEDGRLRVGEKSYSVVIVPAMRTIMGSTLALLKEFIAEGGHVIVIDGPPPRKDGEVSEEPAEVLADCKVCKLDKRSIVPALDKALPAKVSVRSRGRPAPSIYYQHRREGTQHVFFFANISRESAVKAEVALPFVGALYELDTDTGEARALPVTVREGQTEVALDFPEMGARLLVLDEGEKPRIGKQQPAFTEAGSLSLEGEWSLERVGPNALTLDRCRYRIGDDKEWSEPIEVIHLQKMLAAKGEALDITLRFEFESRITGKNRHFELVMESPENFTIKVNETPVPSKDRGWWRDISFRRINIAPYVVEGTNVIELATRFGEEAETAAQLADPELHESIKNRIKYGTELESIYVIGDFGVRSEGEFEETERRALWTPGPFVIEEEPFLEEPTRLVESGLPFFAGTVALRKVFRWEPQEGRVLLDLGRPDAIVARVRVNDKPAGELLWAPWSIEITDLLEEGDNEIVIELTNSCRNLLGPHHHAGGELYGVGPTQFSAAGPDWLDASTGQKGNWDDRYCLVRFGTGQTPRIVWGE